MTLKKLEKSLFFLIFFCFVLFAHTDAWSEFLVTSAIVEFNTGTPKQQDIEIVSQSTGDDYVVSEIYEVINPGTANETRQLIDDPANSGLLVTPDKMILSGGSHKVLRFVLLKVLDDKEHIYRVVVKPVIKGIDNSGKLGLKVLVGYEILVIVRPSSIQPSYNAVRSGNKIKVTNKGNSNVLFQNGQQCSGTNDCRAMPVARVYPGTDHTIDLPASAATHYSIWDGVKTDEKDF